ncbi:MAG: hypothetical protein IJ343_13080 [Clostridia bacterium]|nr:hypothetical protein [Clostridia bacterium]
MAAETHAPVNPFEKGKQLLASHHRETPPVKADIVLAIDACASMAPFWRRLKQDALTLPSIVRSAASRIGLSPSDVRLRIVAFRDLYIQPVAFECSPFCTLEEPDETLLQPDPAPAPAAPPAPAGPLTEDAAGGPGAPDDEESPEMEEAAETPAPPPPANLKTLRDFIASVEPYGKGGPNTSGLEALIAALHSLWRREGSMRDRILIISDSAAYNLDEPLRSFDPEYESILRSVLPPDSSDLPETLDGLRKLWRDGVGDIDNWNSRVLLFTPAVWPWTQLSTWSRITSMPQPPEGVRQLQLSHVLTTAFATM